MLTHQTLQSPQAVALHQPLERGDEGALERFWEKAAAQGAPLIEDLEANAP